MKKLFDQNREKLTPSEDARVWNALQEERRAHLAGGRRPRWIWPGLTAGAAVALVAVMFFVSRGTEPLGTDASGPEANGEALRGSGGVDLAENQEAAEQVIRDEGSTDKPEPESMSRRLLIGVENDVYDSPTDRSGVPVGAEGVEVPEELYPVDEISVPSAEERRVRGAEDKNQENLPYRGGRPSETDFDPFDSPVGNDSRSMRSESEVKRKPGLFTLAENERSKESGSEGTQVSGRRPVSQPAPSEPPPISVGGTDPVNGESYDAMFFQGYGVNPFIAVEDDRFSTFAVDVDNASYTMTRSYLLGGNLPPRDAVRVEEFINALDHHYPAPSGKLIATREPVPSRFGTFAIYLEAAPSPYNSKNVLMRVGLKGREVDAVNRKPANLTFVIDVSGSMNREDRLGLVKQSLYVLLDALRPSDRVGLVVYGTDARTVLAPTHVEQAQDIRRAIDALAAEGSTNAEAGLLQGYALASQMYSPGSINRVILCSDGVANVGNTGADSILERIHQEAGRGIELTAVGFGMGNYNDVLMEQLANKGDGNYFYVDALGEAKRIFQKNLAGTLETIAKDTKIQVEFSKGVVRRYRLLGYENRDVADKDFRNDVVDAGEVGAGHEVTALFEMRLEDNAKPRDTAAIVRIRYKNPVTGEVVEEARELRVSMIRADSSGTDATFRMDTSAAQFAEVLRGSIWAKDIKLRDVAAMGRQASREMGRPEQAEELVGLIERAASLREQ